MEQKRAERVERLGFDPQAKVKFQPRRRAKGGSSTGSLVGRKWKVAHQEQRAVIRQSVEQRQQQKQSRTGPPPPRTALDRFKKQG
ncbi:WD repeat-containing protein 46 [Oxyura jamaicensis]|uniref:WD repeat-containing protein 46 n=1 Tax=Oxyura jamaicensis TaxID=8884 RepID=UPI0015A50CBA|nr:WD repeat-containing protein 46 [Oxyura jamaicensis]